MTYYELFIYCGLTLCVMFVLWLLNLHVSAQYSETEIRLTVLSTIQIPNKMKKSLRNITLFFQTFFKVVSIKIGLVHFFHSGHGFSLASRPLCTQVFCVATCLRFSTGFITSYVVRDFFTFPFLST